MLKVALTGGIATGKSYVLDRVRGHGVPCLDADVLAHGVTKAGTEATTAIAARFGPAILEPDGSIDRKALGAIVFEDETARRALEAIVHPAVYRSIAAGLRAFELMGSQLAVVDVPLLYETAHERDFDRVIVTACSTGSAPTRPRHVGAGGQTPSERPTTDRRQDSARRLRDSDRRKPGRNRPTGGTDPSQTEHLRI
jgi:dephospho-CoA kinase